MGSKPTGSAGKILHNSIWYGLETVIETLVMLGTSVAVARYLGPTKLGAFSLINFFVAVVNRTAGMGLAAATRKYMSEHLAIGQPGVARAVYHLTYRFQLLGAVLITAVGAAGVAFFGTAHYRTMAYILIASILPGLMSWMPAQANLAFENARKNTTSALGYLISYAAIIVLTLHFRWDLVGVATASLVGRCVEVALRTVPLHAKLRRLPEAPLPEDLRMRIRRFCLQSIGIQVFTCIVWDRSEMVFLGWYSSLQQIAFYSISFGLVNNLLMVPRIFGGATGMTLMVECQRDPDRVDSIVKNACRYLLLVVFPVHLGAAAITREAIRVTYGVKYAGAIPVLIAASLLAIPRAFEEIPNILIRAADEQQKIFRWLVLTGVINITLDWLLVPRFGAVGAAWGNGLSQAFGVWALWRLAQNSYRFSLPLQATLRLGLSGVLMAAAAFGIGKLVHGLPGLILAVVTAAPLYVLLVKLFHGLEASDRVRLEPIGEKLPGPMRRAYAATIDFVTPA